MSFDGSEFEIFKVLQVIDVLLFHWFINDLIYKLLHLFCGVDGYLKLIISRK